MIRICPTDRCPRGSQRWRRETATGAEVMDTSTVDHMIRILAAAKTIGIEGVLSGVRPAVAQTMVTLGINLEGLRMMRTLHDALAWCLERSVVARRTAGGLRAL